jgi:hypothetical protein
MGSLLERSNFRSLTSKAEGLSMIIKCLTVSLFHCLNSSLTGLRKIIQQIYGSILLKLIYKQTTQVFPTSRSKCVTGR